MSEPVIHPGIAPLGFLVGIWSGSGEGSYPTIEPFAYEETITFTHVGKPFLSYTQRTKHRDDGRPLHTEAGYLRMPAPGVVEFVVAHPTGIAEIYEGSFRDEGEVVQILLSSKDIATTSTAKNVTEMQRVFRIDGLRSQIDYTVAMAAVGLPLTHHLQAVLHKQPL
jgi:hypothetical protein